MIDSSRSFGMVMTVSTHSRSASRPASACSARLPALELERLGDDGDRQRAELAGQAGDHRRRAGAGAAAEAGGDEDHVGARQRLDDRVGVLERGLPADVGIGAGAEPLRQLLADLDLDGGLVVLERLDVGVGDDELDAAESDRDHPVDGVAAAAADADHLDLRAAPRLRVERQPQPVGILVAGIALSHVSLR